MYQGKYAKPPARRRRVSSKFPVMLLSLLLLAGLVGGGTLAYLVASTESDVVNTFDPAPVTCKVSEDFTDGETKKNVTAENTSDVPVWLRLKLISYRVNGDGHRIGGAAPILAGAPENGWFEEGGFYYYPEPVAAKTAAPVLFSEISLTPSYDDVDGGKQVIEVMAEAIQARPDTAVQAAWGFIPGT